MTTRRSSATRSDAGSSAIGRPGNVTPLVRPRAGDSLAPATVQGTLALDLDDGLQPPATAPSARHGGADVVDVPNTLRRDLQRWVHTFTQACTEVTSGARPVSQLVRWTTPAVHNELGYRAGVVSRAGVHQPGRTTRTRVPVIRPQVQSVHTCFLSEDMVEFSATVRYGPRCRFLAGRLEVIGGRWQATVLEFG